MEEMEDRRACFNCIHSAWEASSDRFGTAFVFRCKKLLKNMKIVEFCFDRCQFFEKRELDGTEEEIRQRALAEESKKMQKKVTGFIEKKYMEASENDHIRYKIGWALYETWKEFRRK